MKRHTFLAMAVLLALPWVGGAHAGDTPPATCSYTPAGPVTILIGAQQTFGPSSAEECAGLIARIVLDNGTAGFSAGSGCNLGTITIGGSGIVKVRGCETGEVSLNIMSGSTVVQSIGITVDAP